MKQLLDEVKELHEEAAVDKAKDKDRLERLKKKAVEDEAIALTMRAAGLQTLKNKPKVAPQAQNTADDISDDYEDGLDSFPTDTGALTPIKRKQPQLKHTPTPKKRATMTELISQRLEQKALELKLREKELKLAEEKQKLEMEERRALIDWMKSASAK